MKAVVGALVALTILLSTIWVAANAPAVQRFTYSNTIEVEA